MEKFLRDEETFRIHKLSRSEISQHKGMSILIFFLNLILNEIVWI